MLDTSDAAAPALTRMRVAVAGFLTRSAEDEVILITTGRQARSRAITTDRRKLRETAAGLPPTAPAPC